MIFLVISNERGLFEVRQNYQEDLDGLIKNNINKKEVKIIIYETDRKIEGNYQFYSQDNKLKIRTSTEVIVPKILIILR